MIDGETAFCDTFQVGADVVHVRVEALQPHELGSDLLGQCAHCCVFDVSARQTITMTNELEEYCKKLNYIINKFVAHMHIFVLTCQIK